jgi:hypothetical protein
MVAVHVQVHQVLWQMVVHVPLPHTTWFTMCRSLSRRRFEENYDDVMRSCETGDNETGDNATH